MPRQTDLICIPQRQAAMIPQGHEITTAGTRAPVNFKMFTPYDVEMYAVAACGLTVARSSAVRAS
jgi:hypothetical protein